MNRSWSLPILILLVILLLCLACLCLAAVVGAFSFLRIDSSTIGIDTPVEENVEATPWVVRPPATTTAPDAAPGRELQDPTVEGFAVFTETLYTLENTVVPINDPLDLARRLEGKGEIPPTVEPPAAFYANGDTREFWVTNTDNNQNFQVQATLRHVTDHLYFWVEEGVRYNERDLVNLAETFENEIYPTNREFFGSEWSPGVDGDPHLYILYARGLGTSIAGYFSSADQYPPAAHEYSNAAEMFLLSADNVGLDEEFAYSVLAHEFQHMIHWYRDRNEETWMNEGFSEMASFLNGYDVGGTDYLYTLDPDMQLTDWPDSPGDSSAHYGASFLFLTYFLDRFGDEATQRLVAEDDNGMVSIDKVLEEIGAVDPEKGELITADDIFSDWIVASFLQDPDAGDGRYVYNNYPYAPQPSATERVSSCPVTSQTRDASQYGVDYIQIICPGDYTLHFEGSVQVQVVPEDAYSGAYAFWSNQGDESNMTLTREFDFREASAPLTLDYWTWYDLETDYDYLYLTASTDGQTWQILQTPSGTDEDPSGNSYGWGYNGQSGGGNVARWIQETVDISQFAGQQVQLRFDYVTDAAVNGEGLLLDDVAVPEIGYFTDFEAGDGGWEAEGFVRIQNVLPQTFRLALIQRGRTTTIEKFAVSGANSFEVPISIGGDVDEAIFVVSGTTRFTRQKAPYRLSILP